MPQINQWTPRHGRKATNVTRAEYQATLISKLRDMVRETGYSAMRYLAEDTTRVRDYAYSRNVELWRMACDTLRTFDSDAEQFINTTYQPELPLFSLSEVQTNA